MAIRDHIQRVHKLRGRVTTVDPSQRIVELATADGRAHRVYITDISSAGFVWPQEGEDWSIYEENGMWVLGNKFLNQDEAAEFESLQPGDVYPPRFTVDGTPADGFVPTWDAATQTWIAEATGGGGTDFDASTTTKGVTKLSVAPVTPTDPIAVGDNDPRNSNARTPTGTASGDLAGAYPNPTVAGLHLAADTAINHKLTNVTDPTAAQDAATKNYVDNLGTLAQQPAVGVRVRRSADTTVANPSGVIPWNSEDFDTDNFHDNTTNPSRLTVPAGKDGYYQINFNVSVPSAASGTRNASIYKNGSGTGSEAAEQANTTDSSRLQVSTVLYLVAGDYIEGNLYHNSGAAITIQSAWSSLSMVRIPGNSAVLMGPQAPAIGADTYRSTSQSIPNNAWTAVALDSERFDTDTIHDTVTNNTRLTCRTAGVYNVTAAATFAFNATGARGIAIRLNGTAFYGEQLENAVTASFGSSLVAAATLQLVPGDYVEVIVYQNSGAALGLDFSAGITVPAELAMVRIPGSQGAALAVTSTLPSNPVDGQECYYLADATNGVVWHLKYRAGSSSAYKWEYVGGPELFSGVSGDLNSITATTYTAITGRPADITLPLAGDYDMAHGGRPYVQNAAATVIDMQLFLNGTGQLTTLIDHWQGSAGTTTTLWAGAESVSTRIAGIAAGTVVQQRVLVSSGQTGTLSRPWIRIRPVRVG